MTKSNLNYEFYFHDYNNSCDGPLPFESFNLYIIKAWRELESRLTNEYTSEQEKTIFLTVCEIAEEIYLCDSKQGVKSENIDGYAVTYIDTDVRKRVYDIIIRRLGDSGLLYLGVE